MNEQVMWEQWRLAKLNSAHLKFMLSLEEDWESPEAFYVVLRQVWAEAYMAGKQEGTDE